MVKYTKLVIGIDQSYTKTGIAVACDGKLMKVSSIKFKSSETKSDKRKKVASMLVSIIAKNSWKAQEVIIICERIRTFSFGMSKGKSKGFMNVNYIKTTGALIGIIVDIASSHNIKVYSVDTRSWKSKVLGSSKGPTEDKKLEAVNFIKKLGFKVDNDDDAADAGCIALYGFIKESDQKLNKEE